MVRTIRPFQAVIFLSVSLIASFAAMPPAQAQKTSPAKKPAAPKSKKPLPAKVRPPSGDDLLEALDNEDTVRALALVLRGANPNALTEAKTESALGLAAGLGDMKLVRALLERGALINPPDLNVQPLESALSYAQVDAARLLVEKGANVNAGNGDEYTRRPLVLAVKTGDLPLVTLLLDKKAEINHVAPDDEITALYVAAVNGNLPLTQLLLARGADPKLSTELMAAATLGGNIALVDLLVSRGRTLAEPVKETTLLHMAAASGKPEMIQKILDTGANLEAVDANHLTPLMLAAKSFQAEAVTFLVSKKARVDTLTPEYKTALDLVAGEEPDREEADKIPERTATLAVLKKAGAKPAPPSLWKAAVDGDAKKLSAELENGADPNIPDVFKGVPLYYALGYRFSSDSLPLVKVLLENGANPNAPAPDGRTLVEVARDENQDEVIAFLRQAGADTPELDLTEAIARGDDAQTNRLLEKGIVPDADALVYALRRKDDHALLKQLLEKKAKVNTPLRQRAAYSDYPLHAATFAGDVEAVRLLLDHGADPNIRKDKGSVTPLLWITGGDDYKADWFLPPKLPSAEGETKSAANVDAIVRLLVERGADVRAHADLPTHGGVLTALAGAASPKTLEFLIEKGAAADINRATGDTETTPPLLIAVRAGNLDSARFLLDRGANPNDGEARYGAKDTPLMELASGGDRERTPENIAIAKLLIERGADLTVKDTQGRNALRLAEENDNAEVARLIRAAGGTKATVSPAFEMYQAIREGNLKTVERILQKGFSPDGPLPDKSLPLWEAASNGSEEIVRLLLARGADINKVGFMGSALHGAAWRGDVSLVRLLLARGAKVDIEAKYSGTPLSEAAEEGEEEHLEVMRVLLQAGADPNARATEEPGLPLKNALKKGNEAAAELLLKAKADPNLGGGLGMTLFFGGVEGIERLVKAGAKINAQDAGGRTVLMDAAALGRSDVVAWLIEHKANVHLKDKRGRTALMEAVDREKNDCARLLRKAGAK